MQDLFKGGCLAVALSAVAWQTPAALINATDGSSLADVNQTSNLVLETNSDGQLIGVFNVLVNQTRYDVSFIDSSFNQLFANGENLDATDEASATAFSQALFEQVFFDVGDHLFDSNYSLTNGCETNATLLCQILTPFATIARTVDGGGGGGGGGGGPIQIRNVEVKYWAQSVSFINATTNSLSTGIVESLTDTNTAEGFPEFVYADWSLAPSRGLTASIPEPTSVGLLALGLALFWRRISHHTVFC